MKNIWIVGVGGVGGYIGGKLTQLESSDYHISFIARGLHLDSIKERGLILNTQDETGIICKPNIATDDMSQCPPPDLVILSVKSYSLTSVLHTLNPYLQKSTLILPLLNGIDIVERCRKIISIGFIFPACVYVGTHIESPGVVTQAGTAGKIIFGPDPMYPEKDASGLISLFGQAAIPFGYFDNPYTVIWSKYMFIASFGLITAVTGKTLGEVLNNSFLKNQVQLIMEEILTIAKAKKVALPNDIVKTSIHKASTFPYDTKTSYQRDIELPNNENEGELFGGTIVRLGEKFSVSTPTTQKHYASLINNN